MMWLGAIKSASSYFGYTTDFQSVVALELDSDVLNYFKERAAAANAAPYQTEINSELRRIMERNDNGVSYSSLLDDDRFIAAIAERVQEHRKPR